MRRHLPALFLAAALACTGCGKSDAPASSGTAAPAASSSAGADASGLSADELENGIGPVKTLDIAASIDAALATRGEEIFNQKCSACHKLDERYVGPPLRDVSTRRTGRFIMNQLLNPAEMAQKHPEGKQLLAEYLTQMPDQQLTQEDARAILEYLRQAAAQAPGA